MDEIERWERKSWGKGVQTEKGKEAEEEDFGKGLKQEIWNSLGEEKFKENFKEIFCMTCGTTLSSDFV